jgi:hypothetical protein
MEMLERYDEAVSRIVHRLSVGDIVRNAQGGHAALQGRLTQTHLDSHTHKFIQALKLNTSHSGVGYYAPAARTTLTPCVFLCSSRFHLTGKTLRPLLI